jgi:hypothetical protein
MMNSLTVGAVAFVFMFGGALAGMLLNTGLAHYGPETARVRESLRNAVTGVLEQSRVAHQSVIASLNLAARADALYDQIQALEPQNDKRRVLQSQCLAMTVSLGRARWLLYEQASLSVSKPLLVVMIFWLMVTFAIWGALAPANKTLVVTMCVAALSAAGAIYLTGSKVQPIGAALICWGRRKEK